MTHLRKSVLITDLDNTLFDWFSLWFYPFDAMVSQILIKSNIPRSILLSEIKSIHQKHGTSEYAFLIEEIPSLQKAHPGRDLSEIYSDAIDLYRAERKRQMKLYPKVLETLKDIRSKGCLIVGYTESLAFYSNYRIRKLGLDGIFDYLYSPADHDIPSNINIKETRFYSDTEYQLKKTIHKHTPAGLIKPNSTVLLDIINDICAMPSDCVYIGDSLIKDIVMAQDANVTDIHAAYNIVHNKEEYELLRQVTHWTDEMVEREKTITTSNIIPTYVLNSGFYELTDIFRFIAFKGLKDHGR